MKTFKLVLIFFSLFFSQVISFGICPGGTFAAFMGNNPGTTWIGRWVDVAGNEFYDHDFYVPVQIHYNVLLRNASYPGVVERVADEWGFPSMGNQSFFHISIDKSGGNYNYSYTNGIIIDPGDNINMVGFDQGDDFFDPNSNASKQYLAICHVIISAVAYNCTDWYQPNIQGADIVVNPHVDWALIASQSTSTDNSFDFASTIKHEFGHLAGIKHFTTTGNINRVMDLSITKGHPELFLTFGISGSEDLDALRALYGGCDVGQTSWIPCSEFDKGSEFLIAAEDPGTGPGDGCGDGCCGSSERRRMELSDKAFSHIAIFAHRDLFWNINILRKQIVSNGELLAIVANNPENYPDVNAALDNFIDKNAALVDATFRCDLNVIEKDLVLKEENISSSIALINAVLELNITDGLRAELQKIKNKLPNYNNLNIKEAALLYDKPNN